MIQFFKSKRFLFTIISVLIFCLGVFIFHQPLIDMATSITILLAPYLTVETLKPSNKINIPIEDENV